LRSADSTRSRKNDAVRRALKGDAVAADRDRRASGERAFLVGLDYRVRTRNAGKRSLTAGAQAARSPLARRPARHRRAVPPAPASPRA